MIAESIVDKDSSQFIVYIASIAHLDENCKYLTVDEAKRHFGQFIYFIWITRNVNFLSDMGLPHVYTPKPNEFAEMRWYSCRSFFYFHYSSPSVIFQVDIILQVMSCWLYS